MLCSPGFEFAAALCQLPGGMSLYLPEKLKFWPTLRLPGWPCLEIETLNPELSGLLYFRLS